MTPLATLLDTVSSQSAGPLCATYNGSAVNKQQSCTACPSTHPLNSLAPPLPPLLYSEQPHCAKTQHKHLNRCPGVCCAAFVRDHRRTQRGGAYKRLHDDLIKKAWLPYPRTTLSWSMKGLAPVMLPRVNSRRASGIRSLYT